jgi:hypothetical protein
VPVLTCPYSLTKIPAVTVVTRSYDLVCPSCGKPLEISRISRNIAAIFGLIAGAVAWYLATGESQSHQALGWVFPVVYAILAYGIVAPLALMLTADLSLKSEPHAAEIHTHAEPASGGHTPGHD